MGRKTRLSLATLVLVLLQGCSQKNVGRVLREGVPAPGIGPRLLAVYEPWFGHPRHVNVGYSSQDPVVIRKQIEQAKNLGISGFVVDWYGDREPLLDRSYAEVQSIAAEENFGVAMMYDESDPGGDQATDDTLAALEKFRDVYLAPRSTGPSRHILNITADR